MLQTLCHVLLLLDTIQTWNITYKFITSKWGTPNQWEAEYELYRAHHQQHAGKRRPKYYHMRSTPKQVYKPYMNSREPHRRKKSYNHDPTLYPNHNTSYNPYETLRNPYETRRSPYEARYNPYFNISGSTWFSSYTTTEDVLILYDIVRQKKLHNHRARLFNNYDKHFPILFKRAWKHSVGTLFFDNCDVENHLYIQKSNLTRSDSIYVFYEFLKKFRQSLKEVLSWHFHEFPDHSEDALFTQEKSIHDVRFAVYTIENFISYDSNDIDEAWDRENATNRIYQAHIDHVNEKLDMIFRFVEKRYFNFLKKFKYPAAKDEAIITRAGIGTFLYKLCYKVAREIRKEPFFTFRSNFTVKNYTKDDLEVIERYKKYTNKEDACETCEEREVIRNKKKNRI